MANNNSGAKFTASCEHVVELKRTRIDNMDRFQLIYLLKEQINAKRPKLSNISIPLGFAISSLPTLITGVPTDWFGISKDIWYAFFMFIFAASLLVSIIMFIRWVYCKKKFPEKTAEQIVDELIEQSQNDVQ